MAKKIVTFSIDDGTLDDFKVVEIMNRYGIKGTFNINSGRMGTGGIFRQHDTDIKHYRVKEEDYASLYSGHEIACHTVNHKNLTLLDEQEIIHQVEDDRKTLCRVSRQDVIGLAYPEGGTNFDDRVVDIIKRHTGIKYARTIITQNGFALPTDFYRWGVNAHLTSPSIFDRIAKFKEETSDSDQLFLVFFHGYNLQVDGNKYGFEFHDCFAHLERVCEMLAKEGYLFLTMGDVWRRMTEKG